MIPSIELQIMPTEDDFEMKLESQDEPLDDDYAEEKYEPLIVTNPLKKRGKVKVKRPTKVGDSTKDVSPTKKKKSPAQPRKIIKPEEVQCYYCSEMMMNTTMKDHMLDVHGRKFMKTMYGEKRPFKCPACNAALLKDANEANHECFKNRKQKSEVLAGGVVKCNLCDRTFQSEKPIASLELHLQTAHSDERHFACDKCDFRAKRSVILRNHVKRVHLQEKKHICTNCGKAFFTGYELKTHMNVCGLNLTPSKLAVCIECNRNFDNVYALQAHNIHKHKTATDPAVTCDQCGQMFNRAIVMKAHYKAEHPTTVQISEVDCSCEKCKLKFQTSVELNAHLESCLEKSKNFKCEACDLFTWHSHISLRKHYAEVHRNIRDFCDVCGMLVKSASYLPLHKKTVHGGVKEHICDECGKRFTTKYGLRTHIMGVHKRNLEGLFKCDKCDYTAVSDQSVKLHNEAVHIKSVKYHCSQCNYFGYRKDVLKNHINSVHKKLVRHHCDHCEMGFYHKRDKIKHMEKLHSNKL
jgi:hypothetical protein